MRARAPHYAPRAYVPAVWVQAGDSIVEGFGVPAGQCWGDQNLVLLKACGMLAAFFNAGHAGETSANMLTRQGAEVTARFSAAGRFARAHACAAIAGLAIGSNDLATGVAEATLRAHQNTWLAAARAEGFRTFTVSILHRTGSLGVTQAAFDNARLANNNYRTSQVGGLQDFVVNCSEDPRLTNPDDPTYFQTSGPGIHPNSAGCAVMAAYALPAFASYIAST